jgi:hypothetical protein
VVRVGQVHNGRPRKVWCYPTTAEHRINVPAQSRHQPGADPVRVPERPQMLDQAQPGRLYDVVAGRLVETERAGDPAEVAVVTLDQHLPDVMLPLARAPDQLSVRVTAA